MVLANSHLTPTICWDNPIEEAKSTGFSIDSDRICRIGMECGCTKLFRKLLTHMSRLQQQTQKILFFLEQDNVSLFEQRRIQMLQLTVAVFSSGKVGKRIPRPL